MADFNKETKKVLNSDMEKLYENKNLSKDDIFRINLAFSLGK